MHNALSGSGLDSCLTTFQYTNRQSHNQRRRKTMRRALAILIALAVGWIVYMIAMMMTVYDGLLSMIFQPIIAVICSSLTVGMSLLVGLLFKVPVLGRGWRATPIPAGLLVIASLAILCFGSTLGLRHTFMHPETKQPIEGLRPDAALGGYFALLFAISNWPVKPRRKAEPSAAPNGGPATQLGNSGATEGPPSVS
ncbi:MAG TPA: hypothetical protein P5525_03760 [Candidatus Paceibacterota bacterium]|nr:hypothetical protein [Candidatus Paceibacterota bacterium]